MTFGLLLCDHVDESLRHIAGDYDDMFRTWLPADWRVYDLTAGRQPSPAACDAWVGTGSRYSVYDDIPWIHELAAFVRTLHEQRRPFLGVCFGHQMIGHALGGRVERTVRGWGVGVHQFDIARHEPWMRPPLAQVSALMSCRDQVEALPPDAVTLASSKHCPVAMFRTGTCLGVQSHPEWEPAYAEALLTRRAELIGPELAAAARRTLTQPRHSAELAAWARHWLTTVHPAPETTSHAPTTTADPTAA
jgi:GMP synthase-like glutamine amidotransferase